MVFSLLLTASIASGQNFAYERPIVVPSLTEQTSVWVPLDAHAVGLGDPYQIVDAGGTPAPFKRIDETANILGSATMTIGEVPKAAETIPVTTIATMVDGNEETSFQPIAAKEHRFRFSFPNDQAPTALTFRLASGWIDHVKVRIGPSFSALHDAYVGAPGGSSIRLSGEAAKAFEVVITVREGVLQIAEAELLVPSRRLLFRAEPGTTYRLRYGTNEESSMLPAPDVFDDANAVSASLGSVTMIAGGSDTDGDGVPDALDTCVNQHNPDQKDRDSDGLGDACDNAPDYPNTAQKDADKDGIGDARDNCPRDANPDQKDIDLDGVGWVCDDDDRDGVPNAKDNCVGLANANQRDLTNNGIGDACEDDRDTDGVPRETDNCSTTENPDQADRDRDGIGDACDVCPDHRDPKQLDRDGNGIGDVCQSVEEKKERDADGDTIPDAKDLCPRISDPDQKDTDGDMIGDRCDNCPDHQNRDQRDRNDDGIGDVCTDTDDDGLIDPQDNCAPYANADQKDKDEDGTGDPCDDDDGDYIENGRDNCPFDSNRLQEDMDRDGTGNVCDTSDDRWTEQRPWLLWASMAVIILALCGAGAMIVKRTQN